MTLRGNDSAAETRLYMAMELSERSWKLALSDGERRRQVTVAAGELGAVFEAMSRAKARFGLAEDAPVVSCYEAGRDGFWLHRRLTEAGVDNAVIDASSIEVSRRGRRAKTDRLDAAGLLERLMRWVRGERGVWSVVRVPSEEEEDARRLHRERERLKKERSAHRSRIRSLLVTQGVRLKRGRRFDEQLAEVLAREGVLGRDLRAELGRERERLRLVEGQLRAVEAEQRERVRARCGRAEGQVAQLVELVALDVPSAWVFVMEFFGWREFRNRRELAALAGLTGTPYASGDSEREQGISKAGNRRVRAMLIQIAWLWLRYQPESALTQWYQQRFAHGGKRMRRIGIVALARRVLIALWRYLEHGEVPEGAVLGAAS